MISDVLPDRFWNRVMPEPNSGCWIWIGGQSDNGYGAYWVKTTNVGAHRISYEAHKGPIEDGMHIDHLCRVRCCVNPDHLEVVTPKENLHRSPIHQANRTHCPQGHPYSEENTLISVGRRHCRECGRARCREYYHKRKAIDAALGEQEK